MRFICFMCLWGVACLLPGQLMAQKDYLSLALQEKDQAKKLVLLEKSLAQSPTSDACYARGWVYLEQKKYFKAIDDFRTGLENPGTKHISDMEASLCYALYLTEDFGLSIQYGTRAIQHFPNNVFAYRFRGWSYLNTQQYDLALRDFEEALKLEKKDQARALFERQYAWFFLGSYDNALNDINAALALRPGYTRYLERKILILNQMGKEEEALPLVEQIVGEVKQDPVSLTTVGNVFMGKGDYVSALVFHNRAMEIYNKLRQGNPDYYQQNRETLYNIYLYRGRAYELSNNYAEAFADYNRARDLLPGNYQAWNYIGALQAQRQNYEKAIEAYQTCFRLKPDSKDGWINFGYAYGELGRYQEAIEVYNRALALKDLPGKAILLNNRGYMYLEMGKLDMARADLQNSIALDPKLVMAYISMGEYWLGKKDMEQAIGLFDKALAMDYLSRRDYLFAHYKRGMAWNMLNQPLNAIKDLKAALNYDPTYIGTYEQLAVAQYLTEDWCAAQKNAKQAIQLALEQRKQAPVASEYLLKIDAKLKQPCK